MAFATPGATVCSLLSDFDPRVCANVVLPKFSISKPATKIKLVIKKDLLLMTSSFYQAH